MMIASERDKGVDILSELTVYSKYAKFLPDLSRRETWEEIVTRYQVMMLKKYPHLTKEINQNIRFIYEKKVLPSMRALQFAGEAAEVNNARIYNCAYLPVDSLYSFSETMFLLLGGSGVGYSVQQHHVDQLPTIKKSEKKRRFLIQDDIMGWADAVKMLMKAYFEGRPVPDFDFRAIRPKGARLVTAGGKAPGPEPLRLCLENIKKILDTKEEGSKLTDLECHDILCHIANAVLAGGIRRAAMLALFTRTSTAMLTCKSGEWWVENEQRGRCNNSALLDRETMTEREFKELWKAIEDSGSGEPGIYWSNDSNWGTNPCCEVALRPFQFCNLCELNVSNIEDYDDIEGRAIAAAFFGTLQAGFTDFHYLRPIWKKTTELDALIGIGMTGIASKKILEYDLSALAEAIKVENEWVANKIGINTAARQTLVKPSGTTSCVLGTSSGIHAWHDEYFLRTVRFNVSEDIAQYMIVNHEELVEYDQLRPDTICVRIPIHAPEGSIYRTETAIDLLERVKKFAQEWIKPGHVDGINSHNVSATISIDKDRLYVPSSKPCNQWEVNPPSPNEYAKWDEWFTVGDWMWKNKEYYNGLSVLPYDGGTYIQAPFETISKEEYERRVSSLTDIDLLKVMEVDDHVNFNQEASCAGGKCEV